MNFSWLIPGKLAGSMGPVSRDQLRYLKAQGVGALVRMEPRTVSGEEVGLADMAEYVVDFSAPSLEQVGRIVAFIDAQLEGGVAVDVSCRAGMGRTGTVLACYLVHTGHTAEEAIGRVRRLRPGSVEAEGQEQAVYAYEARSQVGRGPQPSP
jgi:atypical dual specificity phosphatase